MDYSVQYTEGEHIGVYEMELPYPCFDLTALKPVATAPSDKTTVETVAVSPVISPYLYEDVFRSWLDSVPGAVEIVIVPAARVPKGQQPFDIGMDFSANFKCNSKHEGRLTAAIVQDGKTLANAGDWILVFGSQVL